MAHPLIFCLISSPPISITRSPVYSTSRSKPTRFLLCKQGAHTCKKHDHLQKYTNKKKMARLAALLLCAAMVAVISSSAHGARTLESTEQLTVSKALSPTPVELDDDPAPDAACVPIQ
jgi:hypothetical protein